MELPEVFRFGVSSPTVPQKFQEFQHALTYGNLKYNNLMSSVCPKFDCWEVLLVKISIALKPVSPDLYGDNNTGLFVYWTFGNGYVLGYWSAFLFSYLIDIASMIEWDGEVINSQPDGQHTSTQMGNSRFPEEGFGKSGYFKNIQVVDSSNNLKAPIEPYTEQSNCYDMQTGINGD
ncbi:Hypothetical predicted protein [Olea europaea subsp. europaea]|uniref:Neprosin PEP catalytic domain-containing protein n=1 Tax=Olea europaea subsp. europaea TaxID=158383 RepID=A0A8S0VLK3_OLEEU|nr:Hypothetical predicted protein [Olea europaea subsp. europaea]